MPDSHEQDDQPDAGAQGRAADFERHAAARRRPLVWEFLTFLAHNKKWWLAPIIVVLVLFGLLVVLGQTGLAPFIYTLF